jgi:ferredoxin
LPVVHFVKQNLSVECPVGTNLRRLALEHGVDLYAFPNNLLNCHGRALCGTCRVRVDEPLALSARAPGDEKKNGWEGPHYRLACKSMVLADVRVITNPRRAQGWMVHPTYEWMQGRE